MGQACGRRACTLMTCRYHANSSTADRVSPDQAISHMVPAPTGAPGAMTAMTGARAPAAGPKPSHQRSAEHTSELQSLMRISYAVFCLKKKNKNTTQQSAQP